MKAKSSDTVTVTYEGFLENGEIFEASESSGPLEFQIGAGSVMPAFESQVVGMGPGETKSFDLAPEEAHGAINPDLILTIDRHILPDHEELQPGAVLGLTMEKEGKPHKVPATITSLDEKTATVDFNHPLAGKILTYKITLKSCSPSDAKD